jgi:hypothetical protein
MGKDHLGNRLCTVSRHIRHDNPLFGSSLNVYNIISRCQYPDVFQFRKLLHHLTVYHTLVCQQHLSLPCTLYDICLLRPVIYHRFSQFIQCPPVVTVGRQGISIQYHNFHTLYFYKIHIQFQPAFYFSKRSPHRRSMRSFSFASAALSCACQIRCSCNSSGINCCRTKLPG